MPTAPSNRSSLPCCMNSRGGWGGVGGSFGSVLRKDSCSEPAEWLTVHQTQQNVWLLFAPKRCPFRVPEIIDISCRSVCPCSTKGCGACATSMISVRILRSWKKVCLMRSQCWSCEHEIAHIQSSQFDTGLGQAA